jgi:hypothetical protein
MASHARGAAPPLLFQLQGPAGKTAPPPPPHTHTDTPGHHQVSTFLQVPRPAGAQLAPSSASAASLRQCGAARLAPGARATH